MLVWTEHALLPVALLVSVTVSVTLCVPREANLWVGVAPVALVPSPKLQAYDEMPLSSVELEALKLQFLPCGTPVQLHVYRATGGELGGASLVVALAVLEKSEDPPVFFASTR